MDLNENDTPTIQLEEWDFEEIQPQEENIAIQEPCEVKNDYEDIFDSIGRFLHQHGIFFGVE